MTLSLMEGRIELTEATRNIISLLKENGEIMDIELKNIDNEYILNFSGIFYSLPILVALRQEEKVSFKLYEVKDYCPNIHIWEKDGDETDSTSLCEINHEDFKKYFKCIPYDYAFKSVLKKFVDCDKTIDKLEDKWFEEFSGLTEFTDEVAEKLYAQNL